MRDASAMTARPKWRCTLAWRNPYSSPPDGMARVLMAVLVDQPHPVPAEIDAKWLEMGPGSGWSVGWECIEQRPIKRWSQAAKAKVRQANLRKRVEKKWPLFATDFVAAELQARPEYYEAKDHV